MSDDSKVSITDLLNNNDINVFVNSKAADIGDKFYHYTKEDNLRKILNKNENSDRFFFVNNIAKMNDLDESGSHKNNAEKIHILCYSSTKHEKIPLWYLYSGLGGRGARFGFTPGKLISFLKSIDTVYPVIDGYKVDYSNPLLKDVDFKLSCGWVCYMLDGFNRVLYRNKVYAIEKYDSGSLKNNYFIKKYPWNYESEFRVVFENLREEKFETIAIRIPESIIPYLDVMFAPEIKVTNDDKKWYNDVGITKVKDSSLKIKMNLFENNKNEIVSIVSKWLEDGKCKIENNRITSVEKERK